MDFAKQIIREAKEREGFQTRYLEGGDVVQFKVNDQQGFYQLLGEFGFDNSQDFEQSTGLTAQDVIDAGWFEFINNRLFPADPETGKVNWGDR